MDVSLSTQLSQMALSDQVSTAVARKGLDQQKIEGANLAKLLDSAAQVISDPNVGRHVNLTA